MEVQEAVKIVAAAFHTPHGVRVRGGRVWVDMTYRAGNGDLVRSSAEARQHTAWHCQAIAVLLADGRTEFKI